VECSADQSGAPGEEAWHRVADPDELADGSVKEIAAAGIILALTRVGGRYGALANRCPHAGGPLAQGTIQNGLLVCPWHGREYDPRTGSCEGYADAVRAYRVDVRADGVYVAI
jgi:nitrite reductase/ring-hydroxylating ferredoxin subunit